MLSPGVKAASFKSFCRSNLISCPSYNHTRALIPTCYFKKKEIAKTSQVKTELPLQSSNKKYTCENFLLLHLFKAPGIYVLPEFTHLYRLLLEILELIEN